MASTEILLESGTNEVEILEFLLEGQSFGLNVHKVTSIEIFEQSRLTAIPETPPEIMGALLYRDETIPLIHAARVVGKNPTEQSDRPVVITVRFNEFDCGLYVNEVNRIHRIHWEQFEPLDMPFVRNSSFSQESMSVLGSVHIEDRDILILDIESIAARLFEGLSMQDIKVNETDADAEADDGDQSGATQSESLAERRARISLMVAEDSVLIRTHMVQILKNAGYTNLSVHENGKKALDTVEQMASEDPDWIGNRLNLLVTDIEMPEMDGLTLCKRIREIEQTSHRHLPVIMFSSLVSEQMALKCKSVGGDDWITKPRIGHLVDVIDSYTINAESNTAAPALV